MGFEVDEEILKETTKCKEGFVCLASEVHGLCKVASSAAGGKVLFVCAEKKTRCPYCVPFGNSFVCNCPTRIELYKRYEV